MNVTARTPEISVEAIDRAVKQLDGAWKVPIDNSFSSAGLQGE
jgi:hypothetical protein